MLQLAVYRAPIGVIVEDRSRYRDQSANESRILTCNMVKTLPGSIKNGMQILVGCRGCCLGPIRVLRAYMVQDGIIDTMPIVPGVWVKTPSYKFTECGIKMIVGGQGIPSEGMALT